MVAIAVISGSSSTPPLFLMKNVPRPLASGVAITTQTQSLGTDTLYTGRQVPGWLCSAVEQRKQALCRIRV